MEMPIQEFKLLLDKWGLWLSDGCVLSRAKCGGYIMEVDKITYSTMPKVKAARDRSLSCDDVHFYSLLNAFELMPQIMKEVIIVEHYPHGLAIRNTREAANFLGIAQSSYKNRLCMARKALLSNYEAQRVTDRKERLTECYRIRTIDGLEQHLSR